MADSQINDTSLAFLQEYALDKYRVQAEDESEILHTIELFFQRADEVIIHLGGRSGRLGECIVGTGLLEATLLALRIKGKAGTQILVVVDAGTIELFNEQLYQAYYWPQIHIISSETYKREEDAWQAHDKHILMLDFHGANDGMPVLRVENEAIDSSRVCLSHLFRVGVRNYAQRGPLRRYADFIEDLFTLPKSIIASDQAQPRILLSAEEEAHSTLLANELGLDPQAIQVICFFQSVVLAKCYERWDEVMLLLCEHLHKRSPGQKVNFFIACGPDDDQPEGFKKADMEIWLKHFTGVCHNASVLVHMIPSLRDLAILIKHATLVLANDTGPGHIAGALRIHTVTPYLPGNLYSLRVWSSTLWHHGVTLAQNTFTFHELEAAILWGKTDIINCISPADLQKTICACLPDELKLTDNCAPA